jgi:uncharacterized coiled-coil protein SlyX
MKWAERIKPKEELRKTTIESANISLDALRETVETLQNHCGYLTEKLERKRIEIEDLCIKVERLEYENKTLKKRIKELEEKDAIRS